MEPAKHNTNDLQNEEKADQDKPSEDDKNPHGKHTKEIVFDFFLTTTAHGFIKVAKNGDKAQFIWACLIFVAFFAFGLHLSFLVRRYLDYPITTNIRFSETPFIFPDVTACLTTPIVHCENRYDFAKSRVIPSLNFSYWDSLKNTYIFWKETYGIENDLLLKYGLATSRKFAYEGNLTSEKTTIAVGLEYQHLNLSFDNAYPYDDPERYRCITIKPTNRNVISLGDEDGLALIFAIFDQFRGVMTPEWIPLISKEWHPGVIVTMHSPGTRPTFNNYFSIQDQTIVYLKVAMTKTTKRKTPKQGCVEESNDKPIRILNPDRSISAFKYTQEDCRTLELQRQMYEKCGCVSNFKVVPADLQDSSGQVSYCLDIDKDILTANRIFKDGNGTVQVELRGAPSCNATLPTCNSTVPIESLLQNARFRQRYDCHKSILETYVVPTDKCPSSCIVYTYESFPVVSSWPINPSMPYFVSKINSVMKEAENYSLTHNLKPDFFQCWDSVKPFAPIMYFQYKSQFNRAIIYASSKESTLYEENDAYPVTTLFSNMGGILGLWIGVSVITICELFELCSLLLLFVLKRFD